MSPSCGQIYQRISTQDRWRIQARNDNSFLIALDAQHLPHLQHTLAPHRVQFTKSPTFQADRDGVRIVNLRIETR